MNFRRLMNETIVANNGEMTRGLKNQLSIVSAFVNDDLELKLDTLKNYGISIYNYVGMRILEFHLDDIKEVLNENETKHSIYKANPQELVRDLRKKEQDNMNHMGYNELGGM